MIALTLWPARLPAQTPEIAALLNSGRFDEARVKLEQAAKTRPGDAQTWNLLGVVRAQLGDSVRAEAAFRTAATIAPRTAPVWLNLGRLYKAREGGAPEAIKAYETVLKIDPQNAEAHHELAVLQQWKGDFQRSLEHLHKLPDADQNRISALLVRCGNEAALGRTKAALDTAARILGDPDITEADVMAVLPVLHSRNAEVARAVLEGLDSKHLLTADGLRDLGTAYEAEGDLAKARAVLARRVQSTGPSAPTLLELARVAWKQKDYEGVLGYLGHARDLEPANAVVHFYFGIACNELKLPAEAKISLEKALALNPDSPIYNYAMGVVLLNYSDKSLAIPYLKKFVQARPEDPRGHLALATAYLGAYQFDEAKAELKIPLASPETRSNAEYLLGRIAAQQDDLPAAIARFKALVAMEPKWPEAHAELGSALFEKEDQDGARRESEAALAIDPENYLANRTLLKLYQLAGDSRVKEQTERMQRLMENRDERLKLMQRSIEVRPY